MSRKKFLDFNQFITEKALPFGQKSVNEADAPIAPVSAAPVAPGTPTTPVAPAPLTIELSNNFTSGKWKLDPAQSAQVMTALGKIDDYVKSAQNSAFKITINSGESQVPNRDADSPHGADGQPQRLAPGQLAMNRSNSIKAVLDQYLATLTAKGIDTKNITVEVGKPVIGTTPWKEGSNPSDPAYTKEQFVNITISGAGQAAGAGTQSSKLDLYSKFGEVVRHQNGRVLGTIHYLSSKNGSGIDTAIEPAEIRLANDNGQYLNKYVPISAADIQRFFGTTNTLQDEAGFAQLSANAIDVPQTDQLFGKTINDAAQYTK